jgi:hypothetical protein
MRASAGFSLTARIARPIWLRVGVHGAYEQRGQAERAQLVRRHADAGGEGNRDLDLPAEVGRLRREQEFEQAAQRQRRTEAGDHHDDGRSASPQAREQEEVERQGQQSRQRHRDEAAREHRPAEGQGADRLAVGHGCADKEGQSQCQIGAPADEVAMGEVGEAKDRIGEGQADGAEARHGAHHQPVGEELQRHGFALRPCAAAMPPR